MSGGTTMIVAVLIPIAGAALIAAAGRHPNRRDAVLLVTTGLLLATVLTLLPDALAERRPESGSWTIVPFLTLQLTLEPLGMLFALVASALWVVNSLYSIGYMRANAEPRQAGFHACFALALAATMGIAFAGNLLTLFLFYELLTLVTYPLVTHRRDADAIAAGRTYLLILVGGSLLFFLPAMIWVFAMTTDLRFIPGGVLAGQLAPLHTSVLLLLFVFGIGKAAVMPVHRWLPAAMVAPTPVSALLHAVAVVKAGVFSITKIVVYTIGTDNFLLPGAGTWLAWAAGFTVIAAALIALRQDDLKRRLAYSTVSQLSYVVLALAVVAPLSVAAAALHIAAHAFGKITLFFVAGSIYTAAHKTRVSELDGIGRRMPWTMAAFTIGAISMIGLPPTVGFVSKWYLVSGAAAEGHLLAAGVVVLGTLLSAAYLLPIVHAAFLRDAADGPDLHPHGEAPWPMVLASSLTAAGVIVLFLFPDVPLALSRQFASPP